MKKWICTICGYIHEGDEPPDVCPICGAPKEAFESFEEGNDQPHPSSVPPAPIVKPAETDDPAKAAYSLSYGLYIITTADGSKMNGQVANTVFQLTSDPLQVAICLNKSNYTNELVTKSKVFAVTTLGKSAFDLVPGFGFRSGRDVDKFAGVTYEKGAQTGCPYLSTGIAYLECKVVNIVDVGTHTLFVGEPVGGRTLSSEEPMTYADYRRLKAGGSAK
ncbi:MAG: flavin reductase [Acidobacteriota bacterium]